MPNSIARSSIKPNSTTKWEMKHALYGRVCGMCFLSVAHDMAQGADKQAGSFNFFHVRKVDTLVAEGASGIFSARWMGAGCHACNSAAEYAGYDDLSEWFVNPFWTKSAPKIAKAWRDAFVAEDASDLPGYDARREARKARGIPF